MEFLHFVIVRNAELSWRAYGRGSIGTEDDKVDSFVRRVLRKILCTFEQNCQLEFYKLILHEGGH